MRHSNSISLAVMLLLAASCLTTGAQGRTWDINIGVGPMAGNTTYQIGGTVRDPEGVDEYWFPISELVFPMNVQQIAVDTTLSLGKQRRFQLSLGAAGNLTSDAGTMEDSDWMTEANPNQLDVYSESDAELDAVMLGADILYKFMQEEIMSIGAGIGFFYQQLDYECHDFVQSYPSSPWWGYDYGWGLGIIYEITYHVPYVQLRADLSLLKEKLQLGISLAVAPYLTAEDYDNHVLREIISYGDYDGIGTMGSLECTFHFLKHWFVEARLEGRAFSADGTQKNYVPVEWSHDIDAEISSAQASFTLAIGASL